METFGDKRPHSLVTLKLCYLDTAQLNSLVAKLYTNVVDLRKASDSVIELDKFIKEHGIISTQLYTFIQNIINVEIEDFKKIPEDLNKSYQKQYHTFDLYG